LPIPQALSNQARFADGPVPLPAPALELYEDGKIDLKDYARLAGEWLSEMLWPTE
jgi:hypothetical protein